MKYILGLDTSCYTTSLAVMDLNGEIVINKQNLLSVKSGERGLQQSNAIFQHLHNLPVITECLRESKFSKNIVGICSSAKPRPVKGSYMPVFMVSHLIGQTLSNILSVPYYQVSHQENHIMAGLYSANGPKTPNFVAVHLSGGTSELLDVSENYNGYNIKIIGATQDLHAGQFVDRVGVAMGLPFPAGPSLEKLALKAVCRNIVIPHYVSGLTIGFSGAETHAQRLLAGDIPKEEVAWGVFICLVKTLQKWIYSAIHDKINKNVLLVGGVSSNQIIRCLLKDALSKMDKDIHLYFADPELSRDNAVGTALLGLKLFTRNDMKHE